MFFDSWEDLFRVLISGVLVYIGLIFLLRISGKRTLSKMNAFDFVVTVALGSTMASVILSETVAIMEGITAFAVLIFSQYTITWLQVRSDRFQSLIKAEPSLLFYRGKFKESVMKQQRITREEVEAAIRASGIPAMERVEAIVLETTGDITVIGENDQDALTTLSNVTNYTVDK